MVSRLRKVKSIYCNPQKHYLQNKDMLESQWINQWTIKKYSTKKKAEKGKQRERVENKMIDVNSYTSIITLNF